jgi:hypothetical protein
VLGNGCTAIAPYVVMVELQALSSRKLQVPTLVAHAAIVLTAAVDTDVAFNNVSM